MVMRVARACSLELISHYLILVFMPAVHSRRVHLASIGQELLETRLGECDSTLLPRALKPQEARARRGYTDESNNKTRVGNFGFLFQNFEFFRNFDVSCALVLQTLCTSWL